MALVNDFVAALQKSGKTLFHFTDERNIATIRAHGLLPTSQLAQANVTAVTGGDEASLGIDRHRGYDRFVRLSFCRQHPMSHVSRQRGQIEVVRILRIDPTVLLRDGVQFADRVATDNDVQLGSPNDMINRMDLEATYKYIDWRVPANHQRRLASEKWEAMIPERIDPNLIGGL